MTFVDTHSHIYSQEFNGDIKDVIQRAKDEGVEKIFLPNIDSKSIAPMMKLVEEFPCSCFPMMGLHPTSVKENYLEELSIAEQWLDKEKFYAIGEIGIDLYWDRTFFKQQQEAFNKQIEWAKKYNLPIIIHSRESFDEIFEILEPHTSPQLTGIFHSFTGDLSQAQKAIEMGFLIGVGGILTFKNAGLDKIISQIDIQNLVLETDSPYLAPTPKRGKRNESSYLKYIAQRLSETHNISLEEVAHITSTNAFKLFGI